MEDKAELSQFQLDLEGIGIDRHSGSPQIIVYRQRNTRALELAR